MSELVMKIIRESVVTTSLLEHEGEIYVRTENPCYIYWNKEMETTLYEHLKSTGRWKTRIKCEWHDCEIPDLERKYQELKSCN